MKHSEHRLLSTAAFTLIELLVVVSIISLLAAIVLVALSSARSKGVIAAAVQFAATNYHAYGSDALAMYNFNQSGAIGSSLTSITDSSVNNFTLGGASCSGITLSSDSPTGAAGNTSASFTSGSTCTVAIPSSLKLPVFTLTGWVKIAQGGSKPELIEINDSGTGNSDMLYTTFSSGNTYLFCKSNGSIFSGLGVLSKTTLKVNTWYHAACVLDATGNLTLYVNGTSEATTQSVSPLVWTGIPSIYMWRDSSVGSSGNLDDVAIYTHALGSAYIHDLYLAGLAMHSDTLAAK